MTEKFRDKFDKPNAMIAAGVWLMAFVVYYLTNAATLSFWDCGEFLAAGYALGIPHPPGTPLYVMMARVFSLLPIDSDLAVRMNLLSVVSSSFTAMFGYLCAVRMLRAWFGDEVDRFGRFLIYAGSVCGAAFVAFSHTNWINSTEAEVYGLAMAISLAMLWLTLTYIEHRGSPRAGCLVAMIVYLGFLGIAVHMTVFLMLPVLALAFIIKRDTPVITWYLVALFFVSELYMIFALSSLPGEIPYYLPVGLVFLVYLFYVFSFESIPRLLIWVGGGFVLSMVPFFKVTLDAIQRVETTSASGGGVWAIAGQVAFGALVLFGLYALMQGFSRKTSKGLKRHYLVVASFVGAAGVMVLLLFVPKGYTTFLVLSAVLAGILILLRWRHMHWPVLVAVLGSSMVILGIGEFAYGIGIALVVVLVMGLKFRLATWRTAVAILVMAVIGFSIHLFIPMRSAHHPYLNENNPSKDLSTTINFLERKQYGSMGMVERMFLRRADWSHQFGDYPRLGFWRFFDQQYGLVDSKFVILFLFGLFGIWEMIRKRAVLGLPLLLLILISTVGLILYMNFSDGTRDVPGVASDHIEVRDRDYFFSPGFILYGLIIGIGITIGIQHVRTATVYLSKGARYAAVGLSMLLLLLPALAVTQNYYSCDRSRNYIPYDYAWNLLQSAEENAVFFTNGDNDTFPLWCLQEVYGVRRDVAVVNLALANTPWYVKQIQTTMGVDMGWTDEHIDNLRPFRLPDQARLQAQGQDLGSNVFGYLGVSVREMDSLRADHAPYGQTFRLRDMVIDKIIYSQLGRRPVNFSVTCGRSTQRYLGEPIFNRLSLIGMAWRVNKEGNSQNVDIERAVEYFTSPDKFRARGVADETIHKSGTAERLTRNWINGFMMTADSLRVAGDYERAEMLVRRGHELIPHAVEPIDFLITLHSERGQPEELQEFLLSLDVGVTERVRALLGNAYRQAGDTAQASVVYEELLSDSPKNRTAFEALLQMYFSSKQYPEMVSLLTRWLEHNPNDTRVRNMLSEIETMRDEQRGRDSNSQ
jgi:tetratricopeptide (TPR) repeat protein